MSNESFNWTTFIISTLISTSISTLIAYLANRFLIIKRQEIKHHSMALNDGSLKIWPKKIDEIFKLGRLSKSTRYSHEDDKIIPIELGSLGVIPHYESLENHMKSGYLEVWIIWNELRQNIQEHNEERANILEDIRLTFLEEHKHLDSKAFYYKVGKKEPTNYVKPDIIAEFILQELERRSHGFEIHWFGEDLKVDYLRAGGGVKIWRVGSSLGDLIHDTKDENASSVAKFIAFTAESNELKQRADKLIKKEGDINIKRDNFEKELKKIISSIELGNSIKGKCQQCP